jgi:hypothetical protein
VPEDDLRLPRLAPAALSVRALLKSQKDQVAGLGTLLPPELRPLPAAVELTRQGLTEQRQAIPALERERAARLREIAAIELEIAERRETVRTVEEWLARGGRPGIPSLAAADPSPTPEPGQIGPIAPGKDNEESEDGPQSELTRLFFQEVFGGRPSRKWGYRKLHERMKDWVVEKNEADGGSRVAASETTIRRVRMAPKI